MMGLFERRTAHSGGGCIPTPPGAWAKATEPVEAPARFSCPEYLDMRPYCLTANDQGRSSTCVGQSVAGMLEVHNWIATSEARQVDGFAIYAEAKKDDPFSPTTAGTTMDAGARAAKRMGLVSENAGLRRVSTLSDLQYAMHRHHVVMGCFRVTDAWNKCSRRTGMIPNVQGMSRGYHAVLMCYYSDREECVGFQNSWGPGWGYHGFGRMRYEQFDRLWVNGLAIEL